MTIIAGTAAASMMASIPMSILAYIGPGTGLSALGTLLAVIAAVLLAVIGFVWYPVKRLVAKLKKNKAGDTK